MHFALEIPEILLCIFDHCRLHYRSNGSLPALARTCRAFKEPALDVLWEELFDPSPLARCLPEASHHQISPAGSECYSFSRSLTQIERDILRGYARRIRSIEDYDHRLDWESVQAVLNPPTVDPLLSNLRRLSTGQSSKIDHLLSMPFPSLVSINIDFSGKKRDVFQGSLESLFRFSPNIRRLAIDICSSGVAFSDFFSRYVCGWQILQSLLCDDITLDMDALAHLSNMPTLTQLAFTLSPTLPEQITSSESPHFFPSLYDFTLHSEFLDSVSRFLSRTRLPAITEFTVLIENCPSKQDISSCMASIQMAGISHSAQDLWLSQRLPPNGPYVPEDSRPVLGLKDLQPCLTFRDLRRINLNVEWKVDLTDGELLALGSAWPRLEHLFINENWGWNMPGGVTPDGLLQLLQICPSLSRIALAIDARGYTGIYSSQTNPGLTRPSISSFDVVDSMIEAESVPAMAAFLASIASRSKFSFRVCGGSFEMEKVYIVRWYDVYGQAKNIISQHS